MKDRDNKREWQGKDPNDRKSIVTKEIDKVAPLWVETKRQKKLDLMIEIIIRIWNAVSKGRNLIGQ